MTLEISTKPIIHIAPDEKFIDAAYEIYEKAFQGKNRFIILLPENHVEIKHLSKDKDYEFVKIKDNYISHILSLIKDARILVFHGMDYNQTELAMAIDKNKIKFIWNVFGYEVYTNPYLFRRNIYGKKTYRNFLFSITKEFKDYFRPYYYRYWKQKQDFNETRIQAFRKMDYVGILYDEEFLLYYKIIGLNNHVKHLKFTYYPLEVIIERDNIQAPENNILLGNSASYTNNHLEAIDILNNLDIGDRKIVCPLSYGRMDYAKEIIQYGNTYFASSFEPLTEFLPLREYQKMLQSCGIVVMNHYRQQAVGNVLNTMYMGAKVYLSNKNTLYHYLKRIGCHVFCIEEDLVHENKKALELLSPHQMEENRHILYGELSLDRICKELQTKLTL